MRVILKCNSLASARSECIACDMLPTDFCCLPLAPKRACWIFIDVSAGWALQAATSHFLGQNFAKAFDVRFLDHDGTRCVAIK